jgi:hypothetical protein
MGLLTSAGLMAMVAGLTHFATFNRLDHQLKRRNFDESRTRSDHHCSAVDRHLPVSTGAGELPFEQQAQVIGPTVGWRRLRRCGRFAIRGIFKVGWTFAAAAYLVRMRNLAIQAVKRSPNMCAATQPASLEIASAPYCREKAVYHNSL